ncbi:hypothetical protein MGG_14898 [Pyricularia oryzae 70-15]|uniref:Secreted protein n=1 Tax=Pyricularia oryzae (strain 70-15 / ATCC MYA-4617 / FGSC 8958) TaxID=242507 RepID=G4NFC9_PYRO7|nr:uncharacterized protein MGG_14898 [Pyricularia oryzae 70-15]EHA47222.1 hypothetical protein MGG_14898 [Pyricularia oryzae 70-15]
MVSFVTRLFLPGAFCVFFFWASRTHSTASDFTNETPTEDAKRVISAQQSVSSVASDMGDVQSCPATSWGHLFGVIPKKKERALAVLETPWVFSLELCFNL